MALLLDDFGKLTPAEGLLIRHLRARDRRVCKVGANVPAASNPGVRLRASLIRELALGHIGDVPLPETGLRLQGAWIDGDGPEDSATQGLDFDGCILNGELQLLACYVEHDIRFVMARIVSLTLTGSSLGGGLVGRGLKASGGIVMDAIPRIRGTIDLLGAELGGSLQLIGPDECTCLFGTAHRPEDRSFGAIRSVDARGLRAGGGVRLRGIQTAGALDFSAAVVTGDMWLSQIAPGPTFRSCNTAGRAWLLLRSCPRKWCSWRWPA